MFLLVCATHELHALLSTVECLGTCTPCVIGYLLVSRHREAVFNISSSAFSHRHLHGAQTSELSTWKNKCIRLAHRCRGECVSYNACGRSVSLGGRMRCHCLRSRTPHSDRSGRALRSSWPCRLGRRGKQHERGSRQSTSSEELLWQSLGPNSEEILRSADHIGCPLE